MTPVVGAELLWSTVDEAASAVVRTSHLGDRYDLDPLDVAYPQMSSRLRRVGPSVLGSTGGLLAVARTRGRAFVIVVPGGGRRRVSVATARHWLAATAESQVEADVAGLSGEARRVVLDALLADVQLRAGWRVRPAADAPLPVLARQAGLTWRLPLVVLAHAAVYAIFLAVWALVAGAAVRGDLDAGAVAIGTGLLLAVVPLRGMAAWSAGSVTVEGGAILKRRLLSGILALDPDTMRHQGAGALLGLSLEAEALETLALAGGYNGLLAIAELLAAGVALAVGYRPYALLPLMAAWIIGTLAIARRYRHRRQAWSHTRLALTHELAEQMVGHRTRLAQERASFESRSTGEDVLRSYDIEARAMDRQALVLRAVSPGGWMLTGFLALLVPLPAGSDVVHLAVSLGGVVLAFHGLEKLASGLTQLTDAAIAWRNVASLLRTPRHSPALHDTDESTVTADQVGFAPRGRVILHDASLVIRPGDRVLLGGPSGAGKSTLVALLGGLRTPTAGSVTGASAVAIAPQFHENHVFGASFAFNLLLGRRWPPTPNDIQDALDVCDELGLGPLLAEMPGGLEQPVGAVGWQLSHGERSRLYVARALLSNAPVIVLDEAFATLDPAALQQTLTCVLSRAPSLVVVAHE